MPRWPALAQLPAGFLVEESPDGVLAVRAEFAGALREQGFRAAGGEAPPASDLAGRRPLGELRAGAARLLVRRFQHGGMLRWMLGRRFADPQRPFRELALSARLQQLGIETPRVVAARARRAAPFGWALDLVTLRVEGAQDLAEWLEALREGRASERARRAIPRAVGACVGRFHAAGLWHADLNPRNLLLAGDALEHGTAAVLVLDLDRSALRPPLPDERRSANLARLLRAVLRREGRGAPFLHRADYARFLAGYLAGAGRPPSELGTAWRGVRVAFERSAGVHRLWWRVEEAFGGGPEGRDGRAAVRRGARGAVDQGKT
jgi:3-deoxy-D-manno-octulosonic acid kinase